MIDLTAARQQVTEPQLIDYGADLTPFLGGPSQRLDRIGSRHMAKVTFPRMTEAESRRWVARLIQAKRQGGQIAFPQTGLEVGAPGSPTVATTTTGGTTLPITGATPYYAIREGQWFNIVSGGRKYLYQASAQAILDASGAGSVALDVPLRAEATATDGINLAKPVLEGWLDGDGFGWSIEMGMTGALSFTIRERA